MESTWARTAALEWAYARVKARAFNGRVPDVPDWRRYPRFRPEHLRLVIDGGAVVAAARVFDLPVASGDTTIRLGGIGDVVVDPEAQRRGYGSAAMRNALDYLDREGFDLSLLYGVPGYYGRFGYRTALAYESCRYRPGEIAAAFPAGWRARKIGRRDVPEMDALYRRTIGRHDLAQAREQVDWDHLLRIKRTDGAILRDPAGSVAGYLLFGRRAGGMLVVGEIALRDDPDAYEAALAFIRERARESFADEIEIATPNGDRFARWCAVRKRIALRRWADRDGGPMLRIVNGAALFGKLAGTFARRWADAPRSAPDCAATLVWPGGTVAFVARDGVLDVRPGECAGAAIALGIEPLTELVTGFRPARDVLADAGIATSDGVIRLIEALFPVGSAFRPPTDKF